MATKYSRGSRRVLDMQDDVATDIAREVQPPKKAAGKSRLMRATMAGSAVVAALSVAFLAFNSYRSSAHAGACGRLRQNLDSALSFPQSSDPIKGLDKKRTEDIDATRSGFQSRYANNPGLDIRQAMFDQYDRWAKGYAAAALAEHSCS